MIALSLYSTRDATRRDRITPPAVDPIPASSLRHALLHVLSRIGLGLGGFALIHDY